MGLVTEEVRAKAEMYTGDEICREKTKCFLKEISMPNGLLPLKDIEEAGYDRESGVVWLKQKQTITHKFENIDKLVSYGTEVTAVVKTGKIKKLTGVKAKELLLWVSISEIYTEEKEKITFKSPTTLSRTFPVSAFVVPEEVEPAKEEPAKEKSSEATEEVTKEEPAKEAAKVEPAKEAVAVKEA
ncbi:hypothetical protein Bca4012_070108 [Brassica carinata]|uniref:Uncharacterized protein n=5 Tax=Brassica TaxID=3705 RepID=A0A0D3C8Q2_BRAOL|nr:PREDICTED: uncharacterized protein LOC106294552 [Brassica oleracea var. oleracea]KAF3583771.1 hypothetical protein F2Q69_00026162 [Brassica cretica]KAG2267699.1 hypothetical protein Bca52824_062254 [Brassica carinata]VDD41941.1 unnamed protein product [Brassica oleracea]